MIPAHRQDHYCQLDLPLDNRWTIPIGGCFGKMFAIGQQKMNTKLEFYYNVEKPEGAPEWSLNWTLQFLLPR